MQVVLDDIRSVQNVATIFRSSDGVGVSKIWLGGYTPGPLDKYGIVIPKFRRISLGAEENIEWEKFSGVLELIQKLQEDGFYVVGVEEGELAEDYRNAVLELEFEKIVLVMGNEKTGLSQEVMELCDRVLEMPMLGEKDSLNVAVAFSVIAYVVRDFLCGKGG